MAPWAPTRTRPATRVFAAARRSVRAACGVAATGLLGALALAAPAPARAASAARVTADAAAVPAALQHEVKAHRLPAADANRDLAGLRATLATLRRLARQGEAGRAADLADALDEIADVARRGKLTRLRHLEAFRQLEANRRWFAARGRPGYRERVKLPGDPLVYAYWPGHGLILHPLFNWVEVNRHWFARDIEGMQRQIDALAPLAVRQPGGWLAWEYDFDYGTGRAPWRSAMAQGVALQALARAWKATGDPVDLALARRALGGLTLADARGGLRVARARAWWPLYAFDPEMKVLNGDLQVVISLLDYGRLTGDARARAWGLAGARAALGVLPRYDTGAWSLYDGRAEADLGYHDLMTHQLGQLADRTGLAGFRLEHRRFAAYRVTPPHVQVAAGPLPDLYPAPRDGFHDSVSLLGRLDKRATLRLDVLDVRGRMVDSTALGTR